jgi:hypothetical protein
MSSSLSDPLANIESPIRVDANFKYTESQLNIAEARRRAAEGSGYSRVLWKLSVTRGPENEYDSLYSMLRPVNVVRKL